jgi:hypothetical protein
MELSADNEIDSIYSTGLASITVAFPVRITSNDIEIPTCCILHQRMILVK